MKTLFLLPKTSLLSSMCVPRAATSLPLSQRGSVLGRLALQVAHLVPAAITVGAQQLTACGTLLLLTLSTSQQVLWFGLRWGGRACWWGRAAGVMVLAGCPHQLPPLLHSGLLFTLGAYQHIAAGQAATPRQAGTLSPSVVLLAVQLL